ncbi:MAG: DUF2490 domain-containing protein [Paludibacteraceae bacterium]|nr:DUF2490 domain-containing protein [Paludibacteraceae bacterium]
MMKSNSVSGLTAKRSNRLFIAVLTALAISQAALAVDYNSTGETREDIVQMRVGADFTKKWDCGVRLHIGEELRFNFYDVEQGTTAKSVAVDTSYGASFYKSYTTLSLAYAHPEFKYLKIDAGYTLRLFGNKGFSDPNEFLRHRVFFGLTGSVKAGQIVKLSLRERFVCDMRTDSVNVLEKSKNAWFLRSRLGAEFSVPGKPVKPYLWCELENTLNAPEYQQNNGQQFISHVRTQVGVKWRLTKLSSLDFYYRFQYGYDRDINITKKKSYIQLTEEKAFLHAIGIAYDLNW